MIDQPTIDKILEAANILEVVSEFVTLRKRGTSYVGLCPFHADKSPSFYVSPAKNICKCFACGEGGTAVHFIMKHEQLTYFDALRWLAKKYHIEIQERELTPRERQMRNDRESMLILNTWAQKYYTSTLLETEEGRSIGMRYFAERGLREDIVRKFQLGYSLDQRDALFKAALRAGYKREYLERTGLIIAPDPGQQVLDRFRGRVIYPIHSLSGKVVAFGGRTLKKGEKTAKYVNSPESEIYHKSSELYGLYFAKQLIVKQDRCYLVEGYMDVIGMHQVGVENVVASSGTALTQGQIRLIHRFTNNITVLYDGDSAGIKAALRGIDMLLEEGMNVKVVLLPDGEDPDSFARKQGASAFAAFMAANETDFIRFKTKLLLEEAGNDPIRRTALIADIVRSISVIPDGIARSVYVRECSSTMEIAEQVLLDEIAKLRQAKREQDALVRSRKRGQEIQPTMPGQPVYPDYDPLQPMDPQGEPVPPADFPPPPPEEEEVVTTGSQPLPSGIPLPEEAVAPASVEMQPRTLDHALRMPRSPLEPYEMTLLRYVVRYGERVLYDYQDEESGEHVQLRVAEYIEQDLSQDDLCFQTPLLKQMLQEAVEHCKQEGFEASRYFLSHPEPTVSKLAADLLSEKYQLSKYHTRYRELDREEDQLETLIPRELYAFKEAYIMQQIKTVQQEIKAHQEQNDLEAVFESMKKLTRLNEIKGVLSKELGERIILKM